MRIASNLLALLLIQAGFSMHSNSKRNVQVVYASLNSAYKSPTAQIILSNRQQDFSVKEGDSISITCKITGHPKPTITWILTGGTLNQRNFNLTNSTLNIPNIKRSEQGRVTCKAENRVGSGIQTRRIQVIYLDKPTLNVGISGNDHNPSSIWYQKSINFQCNVKSNPQAAFTWTKNGAPMVENRAKGLSINYSKDRYTGFAITSLIIDDVKASDLGRYSCVATLGQTGRLYDINDTAATFNYALNTSPPQIAILSQNPVVVNKGDSIRITCQITGGVPLGFVEWIREDGTLMSGTKKRSREDLYILQVSYSDNATYYCVGNNGVGISPQKKIKVYVRRLGKMTYWITPQRFRAAPDYRLSEGSNVRLSCHADADPSFELEYFWFKRTLQNTRELIKPTGVPGLKITRNPQDDVKRAYTIPANSSRLEIHNLSPDDYGVYICAARLRGLDNSIEANASIALGRDSAPSEITTPKLKIKAVEGSDVTLRCDASAVPKPLILFYREENQTMPSGNDIDVSKDGNLLLRSISRDDEGIYFCEAARYNGFTRRSETQTQAMTDIEVLYPPIVVKKYFDIRKKRDAALNLTCIIKDGNPKDNFTYEWFKDGISQGRSKRRNQFQTQSIDNSHFGVYTCSINNSVGQAQCVYNVTNTPYEPELLYFDTRQALSKTAEEMDTYTYLLQWTQRLPRAVEPVIKYKIKWRLVGDATWIEGVQLMPSGAQYGQLISYPITNLVAGFYEVEVQSATRFKEGGTARKIFEVHSRILREVSTTPTYDLAADNYFCSFSDDSKCKFKQGLQNDMNWKLNSDKNQPRRTLGTGPDTDNSDGTVLGAYMYIESSSTKKGDKARLVSPVFRHTGTSQHCLRFFYHMKGEHIGRLRVLISDKKGNEKQLWSKAKHQGNAWNNQLISITQFSQFRIIFEADILQNDGYLGDIAIDDVSLDPVECVFPPTTISPSALGGGNIFQAVVIEP